MKNKEKKSDAASFIGDFILDREELLKTLFRWRSFSLVLILFLMFIISDPEKTVPTTSDYIARLKFTDLIMDGDYSPDLIESIIEDRHVKAVIINVDSQGSTATAAEVLYGSLRKVAETKPTISVMGSVAASGGYVLSLAGDRIFAHKSTITGSVGVIMQTFEFTELAKKVGVELLTFKSAELKGGPTPFEKLTPQMSASMSGLIQDSFHQIVEILKARRNLSAEQFDIVKDGGIFTGNQAVSLNLIDEIGGEKEGVDWLLKNGKIKKDLPIIDYQIIEVDKSLPAWLRASLEFKPLSTLFNFVRAKEANHKPQLMLIP